MLQHGEAVLLLGVRRSESSARAKVVDRYSSDGELYNRHNDVPNCWVYRPIVELSTDDVWVTLLSCRPPWGGTHRELATLYRNALGGECPFVVSDDDTPSCGTSSPRFGCWTCTVVEKDSSAAALIDAGFEDLEPLFEFRDRLKTVSATPHYRSKTRRNGQRGLGPLTLEARAMLLEELLKTQEELGMQLISSDEIRRIKDQWVEDKMTRSLRHLRTLEAAAVAAAD